MATYAQAETVLTIAETIKDLYSEVKSTLVNPPNPDAQGVYEVANGKQALAKTVSLLDKTDGVLAKISSEDDQKYKKLLLIMHDLLLLDKQHLPLALRHDNSRDAYWFNLHYKLINALDAEYKLLY